MRQLMCLFRSEADFLIQFFQLILKDLVLVTDMQVIQVLHQ